MPENTTDNTALLFSAISTLRTPEECRDFLTDLCTMGELHDMAQRLETAKLLLRRVNYQTITTTVGISTATVSRVNRAIRFGTGGYRTVISRLDRSE